jgi:beta-lactamase class D
LADAFSFNAAPYSHQDQDLQHKDRNCARFSTFAKRSNVRKTTGLLLAISLLLACGSGNVNEDSSLKKYFDQYKATGSFGLFDNGHGKFTIYNLSGFSDSAYLPGHTFNIVQSLIALETGIAKDQTLVLDLKQSDTLVGIENCNQSTTLEQALRSGCNHYFLALYGMLDAQKIQYYIDTLGYGSRKGKLIIAKTAPGFWNSTSAKVSCDEQLGLVKKLYFNKLPFQKRTQEILKKMMLRETNSKYQLAFTSSERKTSTGQQESWVIGWVEENQHPFFFSLQINSTEPIAESERITLVKDMLTGYGLLEGKK